VIKYPLSAAIEICEQLDNMQYQRDLAMKVISTLERERDEARTELEMWRDGNILHEIHRNELEKVEQERDEAIKHWEEVQEYGTDEINAAVDLRQKLAQALVERDEARGILNKISDLFIDGTDIYADYENMGMLARNALEETK